MLPAIVTRALFETVTDIGQLTKEERRTLDAYAKKGWLAKGRGGPFPILKNVYAFPSYDFQGEREQAVKLLLALASLDKENAKRGQNG